jgi:hypothetical protein
MPIRPWLMKNISRARRRPGRELRTSHRPARGVRLREARTGKQFFFEKKNQKTFVSWAYAAGEDRDSDIKVFCFFSSEKKKPSSAIGTICWNLTTSNGPLPLAVR